MGAFQRGASRVHAHKLIVETAKSMARETYAVTMRSNRVYSAWKRSCALHGDGENLLPEQYEMIFVNEYFPSMIETARATLARLLGTPISEELKLEIHDALIKDARFRAGRLKAARGRR